jgi:hypothetical protein
MREELIIGSPNDAERLALSGKCLWADATRAAEKLDISAVNVCELDLGASTTEETCALDAVDDSTCDSGPRISPECRPNPAL